MQRQIEAYPQQNLSRFLVQGPGCPALVILARDSVTATALWAARFGREGSTFARETITKEYTR